MTYEGVVRRFAVRIRKLLANIRGDLKALGFKCENVVRTDLDETDFTFHAKRAPGPGIYITFTLRDGCHGQDDPEFPKVAFEIEANTEDGREVARLLPFNYTPDVWVDPSDTELLDSRFDLMMQTDTAELVHLIEKAS
jgi:hypothetical protein